MSAPANRARDDLVPTAKAYDFVLVGVEYAAERQVQVVALNGCVIQRKLDALILRLAHIFDAGRHRRGLRHGNFQQQLVGVLDIVLDRTRELARHQAIIQAHVDGRGFFPLQVRIGEVDGRDARNGHPAEHGPIARIRAQLRKRQVIGDFLASHDAPTGLEPQIVEQVVARQEGFLADAPGARNSGEHGPLVAVAEPGRTVAAQHAGEVIALTIIVVDATKEGDQAAGFLLGRRRNQFGARLQRVVTQGVGYVIPRFRAEFLEQELVVLVPRKDIHGMVVGEDIVVGEITLERLRGALPVRLNGAPAELGPDRAALRQEGAARGLRTVRAVIHAKRKALDKVDIRREIAQRTGHLREIFHLIGQRDRVAHGLPAGAGFVPGSVRIGNRKRGVVREYVREQRPLEPAGLVVLHEVVLIERTRQVDAKANAVVENAGVGIEAGRQALQPGTDHGALLIQVIERSAVIRIARPACERQVVRMRNAGLRNLVLPIGVAIAQGVHVALAKYACGDLRLYERPVLGARKQVQRAGGLGSGNVPFVVHGKPFGRTAFRRDQHHPVRAARTVNRRGRGVLQDGDVFDIAGIEHAQRVTSRGRRAAHAHAARRNGAIVDGHPVDYVQRFVRRADRRAAANANIESRARLAVVLRNVHARHATANKLVGGRNQSLAGVRHVDGGHRARYVLLALRAVAHHDDFLQQDFVQLQFHIDGCGVAYRNGLGQIADEGENQHVVRGGFKAVRPVEPRGGARRGSFDHDVYARQGDIRPRFRNEAGDGDLRKSDVRSKERQQNRER